MSEPTTPLAAQIARLSLLKGRFTLRSGRISSYYLDKYRFSTEPDVLAQLGPLFAARILEISRAEAKFGPITKLAGAELGGIPLVTVASLETRIPAIFVRNSKKDYGTAQQLEGNLEPGDRVILLEDVATTGGQALEAAEVIGNADARVVAVICTIDREEGAREAIQAAGMRFESLFTKRDLGISDD